MTLSRTYTQTATTAKYLAGKLEADLRQIRARFGRPSEEAIQDLSREAAYMLQHGYLAKASYGFEDGNGDWTFVLEYEVTSAGEFEGGSRAGGIPYKDLAGACWATYVWRSEAYWNLTEEERMKAMKAAGVIRTSGPEKSKRHLQQLDSRQYVRDGQALGRTLLG